MKALAAAFLTLSSLHAADAVLVEDGQPRAEIIIAENPTRMQRVAAQEFRANIEKISGARLPIVTQPTGKAVKVFIGASPLNPVKVEGLKEGAYRMQSGGDWLALVGDDSDFVPTEPWAKHNVTSRARRRSFRRLSAHPMACRIPACTKTACVSPETPASLTAPPRRRTNGWKSGASMNAAASMR